MVFKPPENHGVHTAPNTQFSVPRGSRVEGAATYLSHLAQELPQCRRRALGGERFAMQEAAQA